MSSLNSATIDKMKNGLWAATLELLEPKMQVSTFCAWIETLQYLGFDGGTVVLGALNAMHMSWTQKHYSEQILQALRVVDEAVVALRIEETGDCTSSPIELQASVLADVSKPATQLPVSTPAPKPAVKPSAKKHEEFISAIYAENRFDAFVVGDCNRTAFTVSKAVAEAPGINSYNPLVLYGKSGSGKTHLLQSIGRYALEHETAANVVYRTADQFIKDYMRIAVEGRNAGAFYRIYDSADVLILDDLQFLAEKVRTQEELHKILNRMLSKRHQIVLSCDQLPSEIEGLDRRLLNRFEGGLCVTLDPMDLQTRLEFLRRKAASEGFGLALSEESLQWLAMHFRSNVRELEGVLIKLLAYRNLLNGEISLASIRSLVGEVVRQQSASLSLKTIADAVALEFGIKPGLLSAKSRVQTISLPRKVAIKLCRELTDQSLEAIGLQFNRDYSTVIASIKSLDAQLPEDEALRDRMDTIRLSLLT